MSNKCFTAIAGTMFLIFALTGCGGGYSGNSVTLSWDAPATNADGTPLTDLAGYKIYYGPSSGDYTRSIDVGNNRQVMIDGLSSGSWCFAITAYNASGSESAYSNEVCTYF